MCSAESPDYPDRGGGCTGASGGAAESGAVFPIKGAAAGVIGGGGCVSGFVSGVDPCGWADMGAPELACGGAVPAGAPVGGGVGLGVTVPCGGVGGLGFAPASF